MRLVELTTSAPLDATVVDGVLVQEQDGWAQARAVEVQERVLGWGASGLVADVRRQPQERSALRVKDLEFQFEAGFRLSAPALIVRAGEILWVVGPNGSGKTTLLKSLALLLRPHRGHLHFDRMQESLAINLAEGNRSIDPVHRFALYQFQDPDDQIYCESVHGELVATARQCHGVDNYLVHKYSEQLGLSSRLQDSPWDLSRSERRILTLGSVLCAKPAVAMLDEPTVELDVNQKMLIAGALTDFAVSGGACVVVSHDSHFMEAICTKRLDVRGGRVASGWS
jgi:energy-coupling factor transport system ATP-binding protein